MVNDSAMNTSTTHGRSLPGEAEILYLNDKGCELPSEDLSERVIEPWPQSAMARL